MPFSIINFKIEKPNLIAGIIVAISFWSSGSRSFAASAFFDQGTSYYQSGDYLAASAAFSWAIRQSPNDANAHYYLGNTLVKLGRMQEAQLHYIAAIRATADPKIRSYSQAALAELAKSNGGAATQQPGFSIQNQSMVQNSMNYGVAPQMAPGVSAAATDQGRNKPALTSLPWAKVTKDDQRQRANQMIDQQADFTSAGMLNMGNAEAAAVQRDGQYKANGARTAATLTSQDMARAKIQGTNQPLFTQAEIQAAQQKGDIASQDAMLEANQRSLEAVQYAKAKVWETQAAAKNLQDQLNAPATVGGAKLKAEGTNLYVRNFDTPIIDPGPPLKAEPGRLQVVAPLGATPRYWENSPGTKSGGSKDDGNGANARSSVYGKVMQ